MTPLSYRLGGTGLDHSWSLGSMAVERQRTIIRGVPVCWLPTANNFSDAPAFHSATWSGPRNATALSDTTSTSYALALPMFWRSYESPRRYRISHAASGIGKRLARSSSKESVRLDMAPMATTIASWLSAIRRLCAKAAVADSVAVEASLRASRTSRRLTTNPTHAPTATTTDTSKLSHSGRKKSMTCSVETSADKRRRP